MSGLIPDEYALALAASYDAATSRIERWIALLDEEDAYGHD